MHMKRGWAAMVLGVALLAATPALAAGRWTLGANGGMAIPTGDFGDVMEPGFEGGVFADYWPSEQFAIGVDVAGNFHTAKDEINDQLNAVTEALLYLGGATTASSDLELKSSILRFGVRGTHAVPTTGPVDPFVQAGVGFYRLNAKLEGSVTADGFTVDVDESEDDTKIGVSGAVGAMFETSPSFSVGVQAQIHNVFSDPESTQYFSIAAVARFATGSR